MSQMKPYCFKCGAELDPEAIYCPECGRLQRSMVVRAVEPAARSVPPVAPPGQPSYSEEPQYPDPSHHQQQAEQHPDQHEPFDEQGWDQAGGGQPASDESAEEEARVYAQRTYPGQQPYSEQPYPAQEYPQQPYHAHEDAYATPENGYDAGDDDAHVAREETYAIPDAGHQDYPGGQYSADEYSSQGYATSEAHDQPYDYAAPQSEAHDQPYDYVAPQSEAHDQPYDYAAPQSEAHDRPYDYAAPQSEAHDQPYGYHAPQYAAPDQAYPYQGYYSSAEDASDGGDPYRLEPWQSAPPRQGSNVVRIVAIAGLGLLGLFAVGLLIGHLISGPSTSDNTTPAAQQSTLPTVAPTAPAAQQPTASAAPSTTPVQGAGSANFRVLNSSIPSRCSSRQGCPVQVTLKNNGGNGGGTVTVTLNDDGGNGSPIATYSGPIPTTDAGQTVTVNGYATGDRLPQYLIGGGLVGISKVDVKNG
jgi:hypothetical protein